jgi:Uma2 family endonuclease
MAATTKLVTYEEWLEMPEVEDATEEVVKGEIRIMPPAKSKHARIVNRLKKTLDRQLSEETYEIFDTNFGLIIRRSPLTSRVPDIAVFRKSSTVEIDGYFHSAPELIVEVLSPGNRYDERAEKLCDYESLGVPEFWVVSPQARTFEVFQLVNGKLTLVAALREGILHPARFPEVAVDISSVWAEIR